jgi:hypothetical protein
VNDACDIESLREAGNLSSETNSFADVIVLRSCGREEVRCRVFELCR